MKPLILTPVIVYEKELFMVLTLYKLISSSLLRKKSSYMDIVYT